MGVLDQYFLDHGRMGLISLDSDRRVDICIGKLVSELSKGSVAIEALPVLIGLDDVLDDIAGGRQSELLLPRVTIQAGYLAGKTLSMQIMPAEAPKSVQILIRDESELAELEQGVLQHRNELALANEALAEARARAEEALRQKASFLANISHDLKTPLQVIIGNAEILRGDLSKEERDEFLEDVLDNSNFLLALITDLLDASALEANQLALTEEAIDIGSLLERIVSMARQIPDGMQRHFELEVDERSPLIMADPMRLRRILLNLVSNAVKFTDVGGRIVLRAEPKAAGEFIVEVEDDGCGIEPAMIQHVFEPFTSAGSQDGTGLGLHISKSLADLHQANLSLSSEPGVGTTARLCLPKARVVKAPS